MKMEKTEHKQFKPFDKVLIKYGRVWVVDFYRNYVESSNIHLTLTGTSYDDGILPYEGNEHLVGTTDEPDEEVKLEEGEWVVAKTDNKNLVFAKYQGHTGLPWSNIEVEFFNGNVFSVDEIIRFSDFNPNDMEETRKHILCVKNGKIVKYKE